LLMPTIPLASYKSGSTYTGNLIVQNSQQVTGSIDITGQFLINGTPISGSGGTVNTGSLMVTGSVVGNVLTFTKGDASTFNLTVATGSGGGISAPVVIPRTNGTASYSGYTGSLYTMDCASGSNFIINLSTSSLSILNPINISSGQEINLTVNQTASISGISTDLSNLQFNTNINVPLSLPAYKATVSSSAIDVIRFTAQNTSSLETYGYYQNLTPRTIQFATFISASGGTITTSGSYKIHTFTGSGTFDIFSVGSSPYNAVETLVVAGGGGGGYDDGGGGGAGGLIYSSSYVVTSGAKTVTIGNGGAAANSGNYHGFNGQNSVFDTITAIGGGGGGFRSDDNTSTGNKGATGGSGGGSSITVAGNQGATGGTGTSGQGYAGGQSLGGPPYSAGGGGGASQVGQDPTTNNGANGGSGSYYAQFTAVGGSPAGYFAGGGASGLRSGGSGVAGTGGIGGGGNGNINATGSNAVTNTGGGGAGTPYGVGTVSAGAGGSGIVIIKYQYQA
jgi:hypothetical protein